MASPCTGGTPSQPPGCEWSRNLVSNICPGRGLNTGQGKTEPKPNQNGRERHHSSSTAHPHENEKMWLNNEILMMLQLLLYTAK